MRVTPNFAVPAGGMTVKLRTGGSATEGTDYTLSPNPLTFAAGDAVKTVRITTEDDNEYEPLGEMIYLYAESTHSDPGSRWKGSHGIGIGDDDPAPLTGLTGSTSTDDATFSGALKLNPAFDAATMTYTATVANQVTHVKLTPTGGRGNAKVEAAKVKVGRQGATLAAVASGTASAAIALAVGANAIVVVAEVAPKSDSEDRKTYTYTYKVTVTRQPPRRCRCRRLRTRSLRAAP